MTTLNGAGHHPIVGSVRRDFCKPQQLRKAEDGESDRTVRAAKQSLVSYLCLDSTVAGSATLQS